MICLLSLGQLSSERIYHSSEQDTFMSAWRHTHVFSTWRSLGTSMPWTPQDLVSLSQTNKAGADKVAQLEHMANVCHRSILTLIAIEGKSCSNT